MSRTALAAATFLMGWFFWAFYTQPPEETPKRTRLTGHLAAGMLLKISTKLVVT